MAFGADGRVVPPRKTICTKRLRDTIETKTPKPIVFPSILMAPREEENAGIEGGGKEKDFWRFPLKFQCCLWDIDRRFNAENA